MCEGGPEKNILNGRYNNRANIHKSLQRGAGSGREGGGNQSAHKEKAVKLFPAFDQFPRSKPRSQDFVVTFYLVGETLGPDGPHNGGCRGPDARPAFRRLLRSARFRALSQNLCSHSLLFSLTFSQTLTLSHTLSTSLIHPRPLFLPSCLLSISLTPAPSGDALGLPWSRIK